MRAKSMSGLAGASRLVLGTAQLGAAYGAFNAIGALSPAAADELLDAAWAVGINCFDTARAYGEAEQRIGAWRRERGVVPLLVSKLPKRADEGAPGGVESAFAESAHLLGVDRINGYLCHRAADLAKPGVRAALERLLAEGRVERIGVSVYGPDELRRALAVQSVGIVQLPLSLANRRLLDSGAIAEAAAKGILIFARSVFLQGALIAPPERLPPRLAGLRPFVFRLHALAREAGCDAMTLALTAVADLREVRAIVLGGESPEQLRAWNTALAGYQPDRSAIAEAWKIFMDAPPALTDPSYW